MEKNVNNLLDYTSCIRIALRLYTYGVITCIVIMSIMLEL